MRSAAPDARPIGGATLTPAQQVVTRDLEYMSEALADELPRLAGKHLLVTGGAGFLGYYLVQLALHWNRRSGARPIGVTVYDNYVRGMAGWLKELSRDLALTLVRHDMTAPLPEEMGDFQYIIHAASIASPTYYRKYPIETMDANVNGLSRGSCSFRAARFTAIRRRRTFPRRRRIAAASPAPVRAPATTRRSAMARRCV